MEKYNNIIEFSELRDFINTPLRSFSSGMIARLGFSIATEANSDILIVDEVLAVGDTHFPDSSLDGCSSLPLLPRGTHCPSGERHLLSSRRCDLDW